MSIMLIISMVLNAILCIVIIVSLRLLSVSRQIIEFWEFKNSLDETGESYMRRYVYGKPVTEGNQIGRRKGRRKIWARRKHQK